MCAFWRNCNFWGHLMNMIIHENWPSKYVTTSYGLFCKNIWICRLFGTSLPDITTSLNRTGLWQWTRGEKAEN